MNKDQVEGRIDQSIGKLKEAAGSLMGNDKLKADGLADQAMGKVQTVFGDGKEHAKDLAQKVVDKI